jgi:hypothetical protein
MAILVVGAYFGYTATSMAAQASLPGEALYPIKVLGENIALATTFSDEGKVKLKMDFISRRGDELQQLARKVDNSDNKAATQNISNTVKQITQDVSEVKDKLAQMSSDASAAATINTAKVVDDKTLKVEKDIVDAHAVLPTDVKKEVAKDVKDAIVKTEEAGTNALTVIVDKSDEPQTKGSKDAVTDKEITERVGERIKNTEASVEVMTGEVNAISSSTPNIILDKTTNLSTSTISKATTTLKDAVKDVTEVKPKLVQETIAQAKNLLENKDFAAALQKIQETKAIVADVIERAPIINEQIKVETANVSSTAAVASTSATTTAK